MPEKHFFVVQDNNDRHVTQENEVEIIRGRHNSGNAMVWTLSFPELVDLQHTITTYIAGERLG